MDIELITGRYTLHYSDNDTHVFTPTGTECLVGFVCLTLSNRFCLIGVG